MTMGSSGRRDNLKQTIGRFFIYFLGFFILIMIFGGISKPYEMDIDGIVRALVISSASALSWIIGQYIVKTKMAKKK
jgi:hypothetical protein